MNGDLPSPTPAPSARRFGPAALIATALVSAGLAAGGVWFGAKRQQAATSAKASGEPSAEGGVYQCPMHPSVVQDHPGTCPICGMKLLKVDKSKVEPKKAVTQAPNPKGMAVVEIDPERQQLIGIKTEEVVLGTVGGAWRTTGRVTIDETRVRHIHMKIPGFVERIFVDYVGKRVRRGDPLFTIYSPELLAAHDEYLVALKTRGALAKAGGRVEADGEVLVAAARRRLSLWDVPESEIDLITKSGQPSKSLTFYSPVSGVVTKKDVVEGMKLDAGAMPYEIVDLSTVWVLADVYETELRFVVEGMQALLKLNAFPNREFKGKVVFIDPLLDPQTRTVKVRLTFPNPSGELRPEMFGEVVLTGASHEALRIPTDAVIDSGTQKIAFVALGDGKFQPRKLRLGQTDGSFVEILDGLAKGEQVIVRANFLIDSESRLRASLSEMSEGLAPEPQSARVLRPGDEPAEDSQAKPSPAANPPRNLQPAPSQPAHPPSHVHPAPSPPGHTPEHVHPAPNQPGHVHPAPSQPGQAHPAPGPSGHTP
jgi:Cu(I)/Ag(I) efflux system membrane fusion protein